MAPDGPARTAHVAEEPTVTASVARRGNHDVARCGAELVELSERFFHGVFIAAAVFVCLASIAALVLLPTRDSVPSSGPPITVALTLGLILTTPIVIWRAQPLYRLLRARPRLEIVPAVFATALLVYPLRSELWWPACGLLMLLAALVPVRRALGYCLAALVANLVAHTVAGDVTTAPPVSIIGLWVGLVFWTAMFGLITDRLAAAILHVNVPRRDDRPAPLRVATWTPSPPPSVDSPLPRPPAAPDRAVPDGVEAARLTARQLQVVVLLADGLRYSQIAACLAISERQVHRHVANAIERLSVRTPEALVATAIREGLVPS